MILGKPLPLCLPPRGCRLLKQQSSRQSRRRSRRQGPNFPASSATPLNLRHVRYPGHGGGPRLSILTGSKWRVLIPPATRGTDEGGG